ECLQSVCAGFFVARSSPGSDCSFAVGLSDFLTGPVTAAGLSVAAGPAPVVAPGSVAAAAVALCLFVAGPACSVCPAYSVRSFAAVTGKGKADFVSYSLVLRFSFLRSRNSLLPLYFGDRALEFAHNDRARLSSR